MFVGFVVGNILVWALLGGMFMLARVEANAAAVPIYGSWQQITGRTLNESNIAFQISSSYFVNESYPANHTYYGFYEDLVLQIENGSIILKPTSPSHGYVVPANLTFLSSKLTFWSLDSNYTNLTYGNITQINNDAEKTTVNLTSLLSGRDLDLTLTFDSPLLGQFVDSLYGWDTHGTLLHYYSWPVLYCNNSNIRFSYVETWKYTPLDHYDNSTAENGIALLSELNTVELSVVLVDIILGFAVAFPSIDRKGRERAEKKLSDDQEMQKWPTTKENNTLPGASDDSGDED
jgi:hypothetical protein